MRRARSPQSLPGDPGRSTGYVLLSGLVWGCVVTTGETLSQPPLDLSLSDFFIFYPRILLHYGAGGVLLAWLTLRISNFDRRFPVWIAVVPAIAAAMALALLIDRLSVLYLPFWHNDLMAAMAPRISDLAVHMAWIFSVYGGLYVLTFLLLRNEARTRERLRETELARISTEMRMDRARAEETAAVVAPDLLLRALSELAQRYDQNHRRANRLLDMLVQLLRSASASSVSDGAGHPRGKVDVAKSLDQLCRELGLSGESPVLDGARIAEQEADHERIGNQ